MARRESFSGQFGKQKTKHDVRLDQKESEAYIEGGTDAEQEFKEMRERLDRVIRKHYRNLAPRFEPPNLERMQQDFQSLRNILQEESGGKKPESYDRVMLAAAAIRYVDNFIDEVLWEGFERMRNSKGFISESQRETYMAFLDDAYHVASTYDPYMPTEITNIPKLEFELMSHPDQKTFDENIENYLFFKAFDYAYLRNLLTRNTKTESNIWTNEEKKKFRLLAAWDVGRDRNHFNKIEDFNVFRHIYENKLNTNKFIQAILNILDQNIPHTTKALIDSNSSSSNIRKNLTKDTLTEFEQAAVMSCVHMIKKLRSDPMSWLEYDDEE